MAAKRTQGARAERALRTRLRMLDAARRLFLETGYASSTMEAIANEAKVAVQTLYYTFRTKGQLLREVTETTAAGEHGAPPVPDRAWVKEALASESGQRLLALVVEHGTDIYERVSPLWPAIEAAAAVDPEVEQYWRGIAAGRRAAEREFMIRLSNLGALRTSLDVDRATDLMVLLSGHEVYSALVVEAGWGLLEYKAWLFSTLVQQLLDNPCQDPDAVFGLSFSHALPDE